MKKINGVLLGLLSIMSVACLAGCNKEPEGPKTVDINDLSYRDATGTNGLVTSGTHYASNVGVEILKKGGNAFDAAAAVGFALGVTEPNATGLGGQGTFLAYEASTGEVKQYNFNAMIGKNQTTALYSEDEDTHLAEMKRGVLSVAVPGTVMGLTTLVNDLGSGNVTLSEVIQPSIDLCEEGFPLTSTLAATLETDYWINTGNTETLSIYCNYNTRRGEYDRAKRVGEIIKNPNQANVLRTIAEKGAEGFYKGWVRDAMLDAVKEAHTLCEDDFTYYLEHGGYYVNPLHTTYKATSDGTTYDVYSANTSNSGGAILVEMLNEIETYASANNLNLKQMGIDNPDYIHFVGSAMQYAYSDRRAYVADTCINPVTNLPFNDLPIQGVTNKQYAYDRFTKVFNPNKVCLLNSTEDYGEKIGVNPWDYQTTKKVSSYNTDAPNQDSVGTTSFSVVDKDGNMCCLTFTNSSYWGSYVTPAGCGFMLNNGVTNFNYGESINQFQPYKHAAGYLSPSLALIDGAPYCAFGSPGSEKIPTVQAQVFLNMVEHGMNVNDAVQRGRFVSYRCGPNDDVDIAIADPGETYKTRKLISVETYDFSESTLAALKAKGYAIHAYNRPEIAACQALRVNYDANGNRINFEGAGDARRGGKALAY